MLVLAIVLLRPLCREGVIIETLGWVFMRKKSPVIMKDCGELTLFNLKLARILPLL